MTVPAETISSVNWLTLILGPFIGTSFAFMSARLLDAGRRYRERVVAANLALLCIKNQYDDFLLFRRNFRNDVARPGLKGNEPNWVLMRPAFIEFGRYEIDFKSIGFLFERPGHAEVFDLVEYAQTCHRDLISITNVGTKNAQLVQERVAKILIDKPDLDYGEMQVAIGKDLASLMSGMAISYAIRAERNEEAFVKAFTNLRAALDAELQNYWLARLKRWISCKKTPSILIFLDGPKEKYKKESLPPLPKSIAVEIDFDKLNASRP